MGRIQSWWLKFWSNMKLYFFSKNPRISYPINTYVSQSDVIFLGDPETFILLSIQPDMIRYLFRVPFSRILVTNVDIADYTLIEEEFERPSGQIFFSDFVIWLIQANSNALSTFTQFYCPICLVPSSIVILHNYDITQASFREFLKATFLKSNRLI